MIVVDAQDVMKRFGSKLVLDCFNLKIEKGEVIGLLGPNGAGKTTSIRTMLGLIPIDGGEISVFGQRQHGKNRNIKRRIGYVTQELTLYEDMSARQNLEFFGSLYGLDKSTLHSRITKVSELIGLKERIDDRVKRFSGGMKRRLNIGCSLLHQPELLIMDEPTVGIDPQSRNFILRFVKELAAEGTTIIYTSHYIEEVEAIASRIYILDQGHTIASGTLSELIARIQGDSHILIDVRIAQEEKREELLAIPDIKEVVIEQNTYHIIVPGGIAVIDKIIPVLAPLNIVNINSKQPNLEDVFLTLTGKQLRDEV
jgi:ABC-2 type transport system ATP-binding protein